MRRAFMYWKIRIFYFTLFVYGGHVDKTIVEDLLDSTLQLLQPLLIVVLKWT